MTRVVLGRPSGYVYIVHLLKFQSAYLQWTGWGCSSDALFAPFSLCPSISPSFSYSHLCLLSISPFVISSPQYCILPRPYLNLQLSRMPSNYYQPSDDVTWWSEQFVPPDLLNSILQPQFPADTQNYPQQPHVSPLRHSQIQQPYYFPTYPSNASTSYAESSSQFPPQTSFTAQLTSQSHNTSLLPPQNVSCHNHYVSRSSIPLSTSASPITESDATSSKSSKSNPATNWIYWTPTGVVQEGPTIHDVPGRYPCQGCTQTFVNPSDRLRHWKYACAGNSNRITFCCPHCGQNFTRQDAMNKHVKLVRIRFLLCWLCSDSSSLETL